MPIRLTAAEKKVAAKLAAVQKKSTSHSPSPAMLKSVGVEVKHDFCYLSNPHATELFLKYFRRDFSNVAKLRSVVEYYPSQNRTLAEKVFLFLNTSQKSHPLSISPSSATGGSASGGKEGERRINATNIFVGSGATEIIQAVLQNFTKRKIIVPVPTFSPYLEFAPEGVRIIQHQLKKENDFRLETRAFLAQVKKEKPDTVVIINPNNPEGGYHFANDLQSVLRKLKGVGTVIVDESFIHFAGKKIESVSRLVHTYQNLVVIKSLSKDFGVAGVRLGYAVMAQKRVRALLERGYLWNVSGFGEYFLDLLNKDEFLKEYEVARLKAIGERDDFFAQLQKVKGVKVYPSKANMFLIEILDGSKASDLAVRLLVRHGIYVRTCYDKVGLNGEFIRIASRTAKENLKLSGALKNILPE